MGKNLLPRFWFVGKWCTAKASFAASFLDAKTVHDKRWQCNYARTHSDVETNGLSAFMTVFPRPVLPARAKRGHGESNVGGTYSMKRVAAGTHFRLVAFWACESARRWSRLLPGLHFPPLVRTPYTRFYIWVGSRHGGEQWWDLRPVSISSDSAT